MVAMINLCLNYCAFVLEKPFVVYNGIHMYFFSEGNMWVIHFKKLSPVKGFGIKCVCQTYYLKNTFDT